MKKHFDGGLSRALALIVVMLLSACTPNDGPLNVRDLAIDEQGTVVAIYASQFNYDPPEPDQTLDHLGAASEVCLDDGVCLRLVNEDTIEKSSDGWETSSTVWSIERNASWLQHQYGGQFGFDVGLYDIVVADDQTVSVAGGQLGVVTRSADGDWSPTVSDLRTLPQVWMLMVLASALTVLVAVGLAHGRDNYGSRSAKVYWLILPFLLLTSFLLTGHLVGEYALLAALFLVLSTPLSLLGLGIVTGSIVRAARTPGYGMHNLASFGGFAAGLVVSLSGLYVLWSRSFLNWNFTVLLCVGAFVVAAVGLPARLRAFPAPALTPDDLYRIDSPLSTTKFVLVSLVALLSLPVLYWFFLNMRVPELGAWLLASFVPVLGIAWLTTRLDYDRGT